MGIQIESGSKRGTKAHVTADGQLTTYATTISEQSHAAELGNLFNYFTDEMELTSDGYSGILYLSNTGEDAMLKISELTIACSASVGGSGIFKVKFVRKPTGGTLIDSGQDAKFYNYNIGSGNEISVLAKQGFEGATVLDGILPDLDFFYPAAPAYLPIPFDSAILPRGSSLALLIKPPEGNTSMTVRANVDMFLKTVEI